MNKIRTMSILVTLAMLISFASASPVAAEDTCTSSGVPAVSTDQDDYDPFGTVTIYGSGFACGEALSVLVTSPDGSALSGDGAGSPGPDSVTTDQNGEFVLSYQLYGTLPDGSVYTGQEGQYTIQVLDSSGMNLADALFSDGLGYEHACVLTTQGGVKCWGGNQYGQLGDDATEDSNVPVDVEELSSGVIQLAWGYIHTCALLEDGTVKCWGDNHYGQLGNGTSGNISRTPVEVVDLEDSVIQIGVGRSHTCALMENGGVKCWGSNFRWQLGNATSNDSLIPVKVLTRLPPDYDEIVELSDVIQLGIGDQHNCVLTASGGVKCWGSNSVGEAGRQPNVLRAVGVALDVYDLTSGVLQVRAGDNHSCALMETGGVKCWGGNVGGQLGDGGQTTTWMPQDVVYQAPETGELTPLSGITQVSAGYNHSCALTTDCTIACWGGNSRGERGDGTNIWKAWATFTTGLAEEIKQVGAGNMFTCGLTASGGVKCWGDGHKGQLGNGTYSGSLTPVDVVGLSSGVAQLPDQSLTCSSNQPPSAEAGGPYWGDEGGAIPLIGASASDPDGDTLVYDWSVDSVLCSFDGATIPNPELTCIDNGSYTITLNVDDGTNPPVSTEAAVTVSNVAPALGTISVDQYLVPVGTTVYASADFRDPGALDTHRGSWDWGESTSPGSISETGGNGTASDSHSYSAPGVYTIRLIVTDKDGAPSNEAIYQYIVVYDPFAGFVTGGGWIWSPAGAYIPDPTLQGRASFGFVSRYKQGTTTPTGNTNFRFHASALKFQSSSYDWLVVTGSDYARFKGSGSINGDLAPNGEPYNFMVWAGDAIPDTFRIKIWYEDNAEIVVYDNGFDQPIAGGQIQIHLQ